MSDDNDEYDGPVSGPFCRHWGSWGDCDRLCVCGKTCAEHDREEGCDEWRDVDNSLKPAPCV